GIELRRAARGGSERGKHAPLRGDHSDVGTEPASERLQWFFLCCERSGKLDKLIHLASVDRLKQRFSRREMTVECDDTDTGRASHRLEARIRTAGAEDIARGNKQPLPVPERIRPGFPVRTVRCLLQLPRHFLFT